MPCSTASIHSVGMVAVPEKAPANPAALAAKQSVSRPKLTATMAVSLTFPLVTAKMAKAFSGTATIQADREVWTREVESRAKLKKLEFEAMFETRLKELEAKVDASIGQADKVVADIEDSQQRLKERISVISQDLARRVSMLDSRIGYNRRLIEDLRYSWYSQPYYSPYDRRGL